MDDSTEDALGLAPPCPVMFLSPRDAWRVGTLLPFDRSTGLAQVQDHENKQLYTISVPKDIHVMTAPLPEDLLGTTDLVSLEDVHDGPVLVLLRARAEQDMPYTFLGWDQLVLVNPCKPLPPPPTPEVHYQSDRPGVDPHPWAMASRALQHVVDGRGNAAVILNGEPGAGKTTAANEMLAFLLRHVSASVDELVSTPDAPIASLRVEGSIDDFDYTALATLLASKLAISPHCVKVLSAAPDEGDAPSICARVRFEEMGMSKDRVLSGLQSREAAATLGLSDSLQLLECSIEKMKIPLSMAPLHLLHAFCNARTSRNTNASRAAILSRLAIDEQGLLAGMEIRTFLLDTHRVCSPPPGERTFHIFYYFVCGATDLERRRYHIPPMEEITEVTFPLLSRLRSGEGASQRESCSVGVGDWTCDSDDFAASFQELKDAFEACSVSQRIQDWVLRMLAAILHLGSIDFVSRGEASCVETASKPALSFAAECLHVNAESLEAALTTHIRSKDGPVDLHLTPRQAAAARDALIRGLYSKTVQFLTESINHQLAPVAEDGISWLTLVDCMGMEDSSLNDLTTLMGNYANEILHQQYCKMVFERAPAEMREELGLENVDIAPCDDNYPTVKLLRAQNGVFDIIDNESSLPRPSDSDLLAKLTESLRNHPRFERRLSAAHSFEIVHTGGSVEYSVAGMASANRHAVLPEDVRRCLAMSLCTYTAEAFLSPAELRERQEMKAMPADLEGIKRRLEMCPPPPARPTFIALGRKQVDEMVSLLEGAAQFYIRCVRPAKALGGGPRGPLFHGSNVLRQLSALAVVPAVQQKRTMFAIGMTFASFLRSAKLLSKRLLPEGQGDVKERALALCEKAGLAHGEDYAAGKTKVYFQQQPYSDVVEMELDLEVKQARVVQAFARAIVADREWRERQRDAAKVTNLEKLMKEEVEERIRWEKERPGRLLAEQQKLQQDETRWRRNVDNQEAVDYIAIMTGLIEGVERVKQQRSEEQRLAEREHQRQLQSLLEEERYLEAADAEDRLSQRILSQGSKLDRMLQRRFDQERKVYERRSRMQSTQERLLHHRLEEEKRRLKVEKKLQERAAKHESFQKQQRMAREAQEKERLKQEDRERQAREARLRARQAWEEAKREEFEMENIERDVLSRVETQLVESRRRETCQERLKQEKMLQEEKERLDRLQRARIAKQLQREKQEREAKEAEEAEKKRREKEMWVEQNHIRALKEEAKKIHEKTEKRRFAQRQREQAQLSTPRVYQQLLTPSQAGTTAPSTPRPTLDAPRTSQGSFRRTRSVSPGMSPRSAASATPSVASRRSAADSNLPLYHRIPPPSPFVMSNGKPLQSPTLSLNTIQGLRNYHEEVSKSPNRSFRSGSSLRVQNP